MNSELHLVAVLLSLNTCTELTSNQLPESVSYLNENQYGI